MEQKLILLDDDIDDLQPLCDYLRVFGVTDFLATTDVQEAVGSATEERIGKPLVGTVILTDYHMGRVNGYEVMRDVLEINPIVHFIFMSNMPTVPILLEIINLGTGFYFLDKNEPNYFERVLRKIDKAKTSITRKMKRIIDLENRRKEEEQRQREILEAAADTLKILNRHNDGEGSNRGSL